MDIQKHITETLISDLHSKFDDIVIQGLKLKGFEFKDREETENFIKSRCRCEDKPHIKEKVYFVDNIPFLLHDYNIIYEPFNPKEPFAIKANYGGYRYI